VRKKSSFEPSTKQMKNVSLVHGVSLSHWEWVKLGRIQFHTRITRLLQDQIALILLPQLRIHIRPHKIVYHVLGNDDLPVRRRVHFPRLAQQDLHAALDDAHDFRVVFMPVRADVELAEGRDDDLRDAVGGGFGGVYHGDILGCLVRGVVVAELHVARVWVGRRVRES
jgi:hypothetical protein